MWRMTLCKLQPSLRGPADVTGACACARAQPSKEEGTLASGSRRTLFKAIAFTALAALTVFVIAV